ncbi:anthranilate synthase family protein [Nocardia takedensis]
MGAPNSATRTDSLAAILSGRTPSFALLHRPGAGAEGVVDVLSGPVRELDSLAEIPVVTGDGSGRPVHDTLVVIPHRQVAERGFDCVDDRSPLLAMTVTDAHTVALPDLLRGLPDRPAVATDGRFDLDDEDYAEIVGRIIRDEIGAGAGANFVLKRTYLTTLPDYDRDTALAAFRRLLTRETGSYWTFLIHTPERTFLGATPERHISVADGTAVMNPISGTLRYGGSGPRVAEVLAFLADAKEAGELYMVVDEELKMMSRICSSGIRVTGPYLKEMADLAHTEYFIEGRTDADVREILRETMFAPTVTGSPLENACSVVARYEPGGRGYYSGVVALLGRDGRGAATLDSAILIRTADIDARGRVRIGVGATIVRDSDPAAEARETHAKAAGLLAVLGGGRAARVGSDPRVRAALAGRNESIAEFWLTPPPRERGALGAGAGPPRPRLLVIDGEDTFTSMLAHQLAALDVEVTVRRFDEQYTLTDHDLVVMGPGPGDPRRADLPKIARMSLALDELLAARRPFLAICLSHQLLGLRLGFGLRRLDTPNQGVQQKVSVFGRTEQVGFYNTYTVVCDTDVRESEFGAVEVFRDPDSGEVHALRGAGFASVQFHPESILTRDGVRLLRSLVSEVFDSAVAHEAAAATDRPAAQRH